MKQNTLYTISKRKEKTNKQDNEFFNNSTVNKSTLNLLRNQPHTLHD